MSQQYNTSFAKSFQSTRQRMHRIRLDEVDESPHDSMTSNLACCQWHLADVLVVVSARKADGAPPRQKTQHSMRSDTKEKEHKRLDHRARSARERRN